MLTASGSCLGSSRMEIITASSPALNEGRSIPFWDELVNSKRMLDSAAEQEWLDDVERRLREILSRIDPRPTINAYSIQRSADGLTISTITGSQVAKPVIGQLSAGDWPSWNEIVSQVPEFDGTVVIFDAVQTFEWLRCWDMRLQNERIRAEYGIFS